MVHPGGRPSKYNQDIADKIVQGLSMGKTLIKVCDELKIGYSTVTRWIVENKEFGEKYTRARENQIDYLAEDIIQIAEDDSLSPETRRLMIDARKWYAGKLNGKKYGDKQQIDHGGTITLAALVESSMRPAQITTDKPKIIDITPENE